MVNLFWYFVHTVYRYLKRNDCVPLYSTQSHICTHEKKPSFLSDGELCVTIITFVTSVMWCERLGFVSAWTLTFLKQKNLPFFILISSYTVDHQNGSRTSPRFHATLKPASSLASLLLKWDYFVFSLDNFFYYFQILKYSIFRTVQKINNEEIKKQTTNKDKIK